MPEQEQPETAWEAWKRVVRQLTGKKEK